MQRYDERLNGQNPFNESTHIFSKPTYLYFVSNQLDSLNGFCPFNLSSYLCRQIIKTDNNNGKETETRHALRTGRP